MGGDIAVGEFDPAECGQDYCPRGDRTPQQWRHLAVILPLFSEEFIRGDIAVGEFAGGWGGADIFIHTQARVIFFWFQIFEFQYFSGFSEKMIISFFGMTILWIFFVGHHKIGLYLVVISMHFRVFS